jgi:hypothetical protein
MLNKVSRIRKSKVTCLPLYVEARPERKMYTYTHFMYTFYIHDHVYKWSERENMIVLVGLNEGTIGKRK